MKFMVFEWVPLKCVSLQHQSCSGPEALEFTIWGSRCLFFLRERECSWQCSWHRKRKPSGSVEFRGPVGVSKLERLESVWGPEATPCRPRLRSARAEGPVGWTTQPNGDP